MITLAKSLLEPVFGRWSDRMQHRAMLARLPSVTDALGEIQRRWDVRPRDDRQHRPIFVLSAGWRAGSTLVQRLLVSDSRLLLWGEPYANCDLVRKLADGLRSFEHDIPRDQFFIDHYLAQGDPPGALADRWIANLYPMPTDLIEAHRDFFLSLYQAPAIGRGFPRWGFKEVRLSAEYARYLKLLFPEARFLFVYRNPYHAYRSYRSFRSWYDQWPTGPVFTPRQFGRMWQRLLESHLECCNDLDGRTIKFEDLVSEQLDIGALGDYLGLALNPGILKVTVSGERQQGIPSLTWLERRLLRTAVDPLATRLGYMPD